MTRPVVFYLLGIVICSFGPITSAEITVETPKGIIKGKVALNWDKQKFYSFTSIPFAKPPINELRFKAPVPNEPWVGILDATKPSPVCPQYDYDELVGEEDCLRLNVYTPTLDINKKLPVMIYIHGGGYFVGTGSSSVHGPDFLLTQKIVLVTVDYRLGFLGSLSFKDQIQGVPGNAHMKDQVLALQWVKENIKLFGGNENLVTAFGESAGGASVHMLMLSPMTKGLVHRVIAQSGCSLTPWNHGLLGTGELIAKQIGIYSENTTEMIKNLQKISLDEFMRTFQAAGELTAPVHKAHIFAPVLETQTNEPAFLPKYPADLIATPSNNVPLMMGYNDNDTLLFQITKRIFTGQALIYDDLNLTIPHDLKIPNDAERTKLISALKYTFYDNKDIDNTTNVGQSLLHSLGPWFITGYLQSLQKHMDNNHNVYFYKFSSDTRLNYYKRLHPVTAKYKGASHMDELGYLFKRDDTPYFEKDSAEDVGWRTLVKIWTDFARHGNPTPDNKPIKWNKVTDVKDIVYIDINVGKLEEHHAPDKIVFDFWRNLYEKYNKIRF